MSKRLDTLVAEINADPVRRARVDAYAAAIRVEQAIEARARAEEAARCASLVQAAVWYGRALREVDVAHRGGSNKAYLRAEAEEFEARHALSVICRALAGDERAREDDHE